MSRLRHLFHPALLLAALLAGGCGQMPRMGFTAEQEEQLRRTQAESAQAMEAWLILRKATRRDTPRYSGEHAVDAWDRARRGFSFAWVEHPLIDQEMRRYQRDPEMVWRISERAEPWLHHILVEVEQRGLPTELALLPVIESSFRPEAVSTSQAGGIWQFIPSTARFLGMKQTKTYDERRDVYAATRHALDYLSMLGDKFNKDWMLALTAYYWGWGNVQRTLERSGVPPEEWDFWTTRFPKDVKEYAPRLVAVCQLFGEPDRYGLRLKDVPNQPYFAAIEAPGAVNLRKLAQQADIPQAELLRLNPGYSGTSTTDPRATRRILVPLTAQANAERALDGSVMLTSSTPARATMTRAGAKPRTQPPPDLGNGARRVHRVETGDTLYAVARRHGLDVNELAALNGISLSDGLKPGQELLLTP